MGRTQQTGLAKAVESGVTDGLARAAPTIVDTCLNALWDHAWFPFLVGAQARLIETGMKPRQAWDLGRKVLLEYVRSEKLTFGDPAFDWGPQGGRSVVQECEIDYWEVRP